MNNFTALSATIALCFLSCQSQPETLGIVYQLPKKLKEVSGIIYEPKSALLWAVEDHGNENKIYRLATDGSIERTVTIEGVQNIDWEDITRDPNGNLYIGDFGNNDNDRKDLAIYKINAADLQTNQSVPALKTSWTYPEQNEFPPKESERFFDVEGFFIYNDFFYLFTKNRSSNFDGTTFLYKIAAKSGTNPAVLVGKFQTCNDYKNCAVTSAAMSPDNSKVIILSHSKVWLFENFKNDNFLNANATELALNHNSQKESICFKDNNTLLIADERSKKTGGNLYEVSITALKTQP